MFTEMQMLSVWRIRLEQRLCFYWSNCWLKEANRLKNTQTGHLKQTNKQNHTKTCTFPIASQTRHEFFFSFLNNLSSLVPLTAQYFTVSKLSVIQEPSFPFPSPVDLEKLSRQYTLKGWKEFQCRDQVNYVVLCCLKLCICIFCRADQFCFAANISLCFSDYVLIK